MRIIAGKAGGLKLKSLKGRDVRPTLDRVKESMFNIIAFDLPGAEVLDLFAGFGSLGIEALSRGAVKADFVEINRSHLKIIEENLKKAKLFEQAELFTQDVYLYLKTCSRKYDLIFMDPPYEKEMTAEAVRLIIENNLLKEKGLIISERSGTEKAEEFNGLSIIKNKRYGNSLLTIYKLN
ncbi:16S rRNA (guanine966-N2)-methyltransferase [Halanaerobium saccharolyticum]|uniref:16S rRNA (Guanine966-N2)-methyltransferase n=1 Tax=Halanaerobium saccharolyticum TaxID=43595 RepID=A0A4R7YJW0_9FIRM|nr:16S rRNA (guanine(966)-N(2))-methyltransferase RsmD [Halanaerobium saccharolyticum]RAK04082.1 16S rRNA (guanine966-N2)-methyltransferase [Halanaerobium saccharolyticum]TDV97652.1 16S rRNA (guanine966-N2)-methyltransferase [Halanaerobium saccharolyticum]TDX50921.1 16S rRNA (guanine966-N2)-methyltransferase [Halanaerobium saccharolyticum]